MPGFEVTETSCEMKTTVKSSNRPVFLTLLSNINCFSCIKNHFCIRYNSFICMAVMKSYILVCVMTSAVRGMRAVIG